MILSNLLAFTLNSIRWLLDFNVNVKIDFVPQSLPLPRKKTFKIHSSSIVAGNKCNIIQKIKYQDQTHTEHTNQKKKAKKKEKMFTGKSEHSSWYIVNGHDNVIRSVDGNLLKIHRNHCHKIYMRLYKLPTEQKKKIEISASKKKIFIYKSQNRFEAVHTHTHTHAKVRLCQCHQTQIPMK